MVHKEFEEVGCHIELGGRATLWDFRPCARFGEIEKRGLVRRGRGRNLGKEWTSDALSTATSGIFDRFDESSFTAMILRRQTLNTLVDLQFMSFLAVCDPPELLLWSTAHEAIDTSEYFLHAS